MQTYHTCTMRRLICMRYRRRPLTASMLLWRRSVDMQSDFSVAGFAIGMPT